MNKEQIPFAVIIGPDELKAGFVRVKEQKGKDASGGEAVDNGEQVKREELVAWLRQRIRGGAGSGGDY